MMMMMMMYLFCPGEMKTIHALFIELLFVEPVAEIHCYHCTASRCRARLLLVFNITALYILLQNDRVFLCCCENRCCKIMYYVISRH